jgi:hypothetical protein
MTSRSSRLVRIAGLVVFAASLTSGFGAQQPAGADAVRISFLSIGADGRPILDLKPEEVQLRVDGRPRPLASLDIVPGAGAGAASPALAVLPAPFGTNVGSGGPSARTTYLVIDDKSFRPGNERLMKQAIDQFLNAVPPTTRVSLQTTPLATVRTDPTTPAEVRAALAKVVGFAMRAPRDGQELVEYENELACRSRETLEALRGLFASLRHDDAPPTVIFFSSGLSATTRTTGTLGTSRCDLSTDNFINVGAAASEARAHVYVVQADLTPTQRSEGLENLAGVTGAQVQVLAASGETGLNRIVVETSAPYIAAFQPDPSERNGRPHRIELRVTRPDVTVRAGTQIVIARPEAGNARKTAATPRDMLRAAAVHRDLPLRVAAFPSRDAGDRIKLVAVGEVADPAAKLTAAALGVYDAKGRLTAQSTAPPESLGTMPLTFAAVVPPGPYRVRLAAIDAAGRSGTADYELTAELTQAGPLKLSALLLGAPGVAFKPMLQFAAEPSAMVTFELYGKPPQQLPLKIELAASVDGPALLQAAPAGSGTSDPDRFIVSGTFALGALEPGDYLVRATVGTPDAGTALLTRTLRKVRKP